jgi:hypothetical protein
VTFESWETTVFDHYDWNPQKHLTLPNPDFENMSKVLSPVAPDKAGVRVYRTNAKRIEAAKLAAPYDVVSTHWTVTDPGTTGPGVVDTSRNL